MVKGRQIQKGAANILIAMVVALAFIPLPVNAVAYPHSAIVCFDYNHNEVVDVEDILYCIAIYIECRYERFCDHDFDGDIDKMDVVAFIERYKMGLSLASIRQAIKENYIILEWTFSDKAVLYKTDLGAVDDYLLRWVSIYKHPYSETYQCASYAQDNTVASYKDIGYGVILSGGGWCHGFNMVLIGDDWHDLDNWWGIEPQGGKPLPHNLSYYKRNYPRGSYDLVFIQFPWDVYKGYLRWRALRITLDNNMPSGWRVDYDNLYHTSANGNVEEPWAFIYDKFLGVGDDHRMAIS